MGPTFTFKGRERRRVTEEQREALIADAKHPSVCECEGATILDEDGEPRCLMCGRGKLPAVAA